MNKISKNIDEMIEKYTKNVLNSSKEIPKIKDLICTDNIGEVIEKMIILHIRTWMLEDAITIAVDDKTIASLKKKIDICFKQKRPMFIETINRMIDNSINSGRKLSELSVKLYGDSEL